MRQGILWKGQEREGRSVNGLQDLSAEEADHQNSKMHLNNGLVALAMSALVIPWTSLHSGTGQDLILLSHVWVT